MTAFDICYSLDKEEEEPEFLCEMLRISYSLFETMNLTHKKTMISICHSLIFVIVMKNWK